MGKNNKKQKVKAPPKAPKAKKPVTILTGFLGAGKTTLVNHILHDNTHGLKFAIIENEFGEVGVDDGVIKQASEEQVIEMMNGCICCTVRGDLVKVLHKLTDRLDAGEIDFDAIIIETTGLADPAPVAQTFFVDENVAKRFVLDGIITMVDTKHVVQHLEDEKAEGIENEAVEQIAFADRIILNKLDLVSEEAVESVLGRIKAINADATVIRATNSIVDPKLLIGIKGFDINRVMEKEPDFLDTSQEHQHDTSVTSISCVLNHELNLNKLESFISELIMSKSNDIFRYKGILAVKGVSNQFVFQGVHMIFSGGFGPRCWKPDEVRQCRFVFIGRNLDKEFLEQGFANCKAEDTLRFNVGDKVLANVGKWKPGKVIKLWEQGNPYKIKLDFDGTCVYGPEDHEMYVRPAQSA